MIPELPTQLRSDQLCDFAPAAPVLPLNCDDFNHIGPHSTIGRTSPYRASFHLTHSTATRPPPGSFFFKAKVRKNMIAAATERTMNVSMYARLPACACND